MQGLPEQAGRSCGGFCPLHEQTQGDAISAGGNIDNISKDNKAITQVHWILCFAFFLHLFQVPDVCLSPSVY